MSKEWEYIQNTNNFYKIYIDGKVYSVRSNKFLKPSVTSRGYYKISLWIDGKCKMWLIHRLLGVHFIRKNRCKTLQINHIDGNKLNNDIDNLEWCTASQNQKHATDTGLRRTLLGSEHGGSKLDEMKVLTIKTLMDFFPRKEVSAIFDISDVTIADIKRNKTWDWMGVDYADNYKANISRWRRKG